MVAMKNTMKHIGFPVSLSLFFLLLSTPNWAFVLNIEILPPAPTSEDRITARIQGEFPSPSWNFVDYRSEIGSGEIRIEVLAEDEGGVSLPVLEPYSFTADLGKLRPGSWRLTVIDAQDSRWIEFEVHPGKRFTPGDANGDGFTDMADPIFLLFFLFEGSEPPPCREEADATGDEELDTSDVVYLLRYLFTGGPPPSSRMECVFPSNCALKDWPPIPCLGHWKCECGRCSPACDMDSCGDGFCDLAGGESQVSCPGDCGQEDCWPVCGAIGSRSEGWYDSCTGELIRWANCADCQAECRYCPSKSEGWYDSCTGELIRWDDCDCE